ncbi:MAG: transcription termination factor NusA, partial [Candidatus Omnitrophota bacterium]|nr:transcription termination factor NusA [Candidatus Omnitrophota bacterium]
MNGEFLAALERIEREKGISKEILFEAIESALMSAARKVIDDPNISKEDIVVKMNKETGEIRVFSEGEEVMSERFGRIAAQTAKQVIIQKIREAERDVIFDKYLKKSGTILSGSVHRFERGNVIVELDDTEAILTKQGQIPREKFRQGEGIRAYLLKVDRGTGGPDIILSRTDEGFVKKLFELEVPEISQGIVEIKAVAREAGERTKVAVCSKDEKVDPVGACVGMRGSRVRDIVKELHGERIDIVRWDDDIREYLQAAVSPAEISRMVINRDNNTITLTVPQDQLSLLIGKKGRNIRLASKLLDWELIAESAGEIVDIPISGVKGIGKKSLEVLQEAGYDNVDKLAGVSMAALMELNGVGEKTARKILAACEDARAAAVERAKAEAEAAAELIEKGAEEEREPGEETAEGTAAEKEVAEKAEPVVQEEAEEAEEAEDAESAESAEQQEKESAEDAVTTAEGEKEGTEEEKIESGQEDSTADE